MKDFFRRLNDLAVFDPGRWPAREIVGRVVGTAAVAAMLLRRILQMPSFPGLLGPAPGIEAWLRDSTFLPRNLIAATFDLTRFYGPHGYTAGEIQCIWAARLAICILESGILLGYIVSFLTRDRAQAVARGFMESIFPLLMGGLPFLIVLTDYDFPRWMPASSRTHPWALGGISFLLIAGAGLNLSGLFVLRRAFTIMSEARTLMRTGVYRIIRHPLYAGQFVAYLGYTLLHFHALTLVLYAVFVAGQVLRARIEERKLAATFPDYEPYRKLTGMFFPRLGRP